MPEDTINQMTRGKIEVVFGDILHTDVDAIVNPANRHMLHGGGLAGTIAGAAGAELRKQSSAKAPIATGEAIITTAGSLDFRAVIHTVGPMWESNDSMAYWRQNDADTDDPDELLARAHFAALKLAWECGYKSVAFPAVSCGVFRFPVERAAPIAIKAVRNALKEYSPPIERVVFCLLDDNHFNHFCAALDADAG